MAELKIKADSGGGTVSFKGPATTTSNAAVQLTLPVDDGTANQYLKTDGSGALSWATPSDNGKILKVEGANLQVSWSTTTTNAWVATGIKDSITPSAASSKIIALFGGHDQYKAGTGHSNYTIGFKVAGGSATYLGNATNGFGYLYTGQSGSTSISTVHAPSYSLGEAIEYELYGKAAGGGTLYVGNGDANVGIVLMEVAA